MTIACFGTINNTYENTFPLLSIWLVQFNHRSPCNFISKSLAMSIHDPDLKVLRSNKDQVFCRHVCLVKKGMCDTWLLRLVMEREVSSDNSFVCIVVKHVFLILFLFSGLDVRRFHDLLFKLS